MLHHRAGAPGARYTTTRAKYIEADSIERILAGQGKTEPIAGSMTRDKFRAAFKERSAGARKITLNNSQLWMAYRAVTEPSQYAIVRGAAGVGKSTALEPIAQIAASQGYDVLGLASTSGAAANLSTIGIEAGTLQAHNLWDVPPDAGKRLYVLDEGSLVGADMFHRFVTAVRPQDRVIIAYDPRQHQSVGAGRIIEELEQAGVATYKLENIVRQRNAPELLEVINHFKAGEMIEGLEKLDARHRVLGIADRTRRFDAMAQWYAAHEDVRMTAPDNRSINELNRVTHRTLQERGQMGADVFEGRVLIGLRDVRQADKKRAITYSAGDVVRWGKKSLNGKVHAGQYTEVVAVDAERNLLTVKVGARTMTYNPERQHGVEIYEAECRALAVGDRIQVTRPWTVTKGLKIANRAQATITALDAKGRGVLEFGDGRQLKWDAAEMPHIDYAYAMTTYSLQYATAEQVLVHIDCGDSRVRSLLDRSLLYMGASRGANNIRVYTDDKALLLSENSPVTRLSEKPMALSPVERQSLSLGAA